MRNFERSKLKSNRDVFCLRCWKIMKYEESVKHRLDAKDHVKSIITSKEYASEAKFMAVAQAMNKIYLSQNVECIENPYKERTRRGRPSD